LALPETQTRPYLFIAIASGLAYAHEYVAALTILDEELREYLCAKTENCSGAKKIPNGIRDIYEIRVRALVASYIDEWIRYQPAAKTQSVLDYQRANLAAALKLTEDKLNLHFEKMGYRSGEIQFDNYDVPPENCSNLFDSIASAGGINLSDKTKTIMTMIYSTITSQKAWLDVVLEDPKYYDEFAWEAKHRAENMVRLKMSCLKLLAEKGKEDIFVRTAEAIALDSYARVEFANVIAPQISATLSQGEKEKRLRRALLAIHSGLAKISDGQSRERAERANDTLPLLDRVKPGETIEAYQSLLGTKAKIERALAEL
jgi:hypothetical protein